MRCPHADELPRRRAGCAPTRSSWIPGCRRTPRPARRCSTSSTRPRRSSRGSRSTRPSSTSAGFGASSGTPTEIASQLRRDVLEQVGLPITVGVARTKFLAKVASAVAKPDGLLVVPPDGEVAFLHPLPVERLWGVGPVTAQKLRDRAVRTVGEVARLSESTLVTWLGGASGRHLYALADNRDPRPVVVGRRRKSVGAQRALGRSRKALGRGRRRSGGLVDRVTRRMRAADRVGRTITLRLRFDDFTRVHAIAHTRAGRPRTRGRSSRRSRRTCWRRRSR